ncbi:MAG: glycosyltransferase [Proteobacteria bacterium]|nr:glycosyltransferase [Pseudomonadota bacterium]
MNALHHKTDFTGEIAVSVIVPVYNASKYLDQCLSSVQEQSLRNFEVIVVNDASTDDSVDVVKKFVNRDSRFKLLCFEFNRGLPAARNAGVDQASGEYLIHLDSDDFWLDSQTLETLHTTATLEGAQVLRFNGLDFENNDLGAPVITPFAAVNVEVTSNPELWIFRSVFLYFFNTAFIRRHKLSFDESISIGEDAIFLSKALPVAMKISSIPDFFYAYRRHQKSMMGNSWDPEDFVEELRASDIVLDNLKDFPAIAEGYVFYRYTQYWVLKLLPRIVLELDENARHSIYDRYRKALDDNKSVFQSCPRVGIKFFISQWLLMHGHVRILDNFVIGVNRLNRFPYFYFGYYLYIANQIKNIVGSFRHRAFNYLKENSSVRRLLSRIEGHFHISDCTAFRNDESLHEYDFDLGMTPKKRGITAMIRVKNEEETIVRSIESILPFFDEILVVDNASTDGTRKLLNALARKHHSHSTIRILSYPFAVARCGMEHAQTSESSLHNLAYYYNWCLGQCRTSHVVKWDADMVLINDCVVKIQFQSFLRRLMTQSPGALGAFMVQTIYLDGSGRAVTTADEIHTEERCFPNEPNIYYKKGKDWECLHRPRFREVVRGDIIFAYEIKDSRKQEFDHWATNSFNGWRKSYEYRNYLLVNAGLQSQQRGFKPVPENHLT